MLDNEGIPIPVTSNDWSPIENFKPEFFADHADFLVWLVDGEGNGFMNIAQYAPKDMTAFAAGLPTADYHITGEWRHIESLSGLEPVAYRPMLEGPDLGRLKQIVEVYSLAA
jgi:hypothetical protein